MDRIEIELERSKVEFEQTQAKAKLVRNECQSLNSSLEEIEIKFRERSTGGGGLGGLFEGLLRH